MTENSTLQCHCVSNVQYNCTVHFIYHSKIQSRVHFYWLYRYLYQNIVGDGLTYHISSIRSNDIFTYKLNFFIYCLFSFIVYWHYQLFLLVILIVENYFLWKMHNAFTQFFKSSEGYKIFRRKSFLCHSYILCTLSYERISTWHTRLLVSRFDNICKTRDVYWNADPAGFDFTNTCFSKFISTSLNRSINSHRIDANANFSNYQGNFVSSSLH